VGFYGMYLECAAEKTPFLVLGRIAAMEMLQGLSPQN
jgi:hypothetical protein